MNNLPILFYMIIILLLTPILTLTINWLVEQFTSWNTAWILPGLAIISSLFLLDILARLKPKVMMKSPIFTNWRDSLAIILGILLASIIFQWPKLSGNNSILFQLLAYALSISIAAIIFYLFGTKHLKGKNNDKHINGQ